MLFQIPVLLNNINQQALYIHFSHAAFEIALIYICSLYIYISFYIVDILWTAKGRISL